MLQKNWQSKESAGVTHGTCRFGRWGKDLCRDYLDLGIYYRFLVSSVYGSGVQFADKNQDPAIHRVCAERVLVSQTL